MSELRARFPVSMRGATLRELVDLASRLDLQARPLRLELEDLRRLALPCVLHWDLNHFVVLKKWQRGGHLVLHDPASGERFLSLTDAGPHFTGVALEISPSPAFEPAQARPPVSWRQLTGGFSGLKRSLGQLFLLAASLQLLLLVAPLFTQWIVDGAIVAGDASLLSVLLIGAGLVLLTRTGMEFARGWLGIFMSIQFGTQWAGRVMAHLLRLPVQWFELRHTGDVVSRFQSVQSIQQAVTGRLVEILLDGLFGLVTLGVMLLYSPLLAAVVIVAVFAYAGVRVLPHGAYHRLNDEVLAHDARAQSHFLESLRAMQAIKLGGLESQRTTRWIDLLVKSANSRMSTQKMSLGFSAGYGLIFGLESLAVIGWGADMAMAGTLTVGMLMAFVAYKDEFSSRMQRFIDNLMAVRMLRLHAERLSDIVLTAREELGSPHIVSPAQATGIPISPSIWFSDVGFRYGEGVPFILRGLNLRIEPGEHVALVGPTGCGKSTLAKLLLGLLIPSEGTVRINEVPLAAHGIGAWRAQVGAVMQDDQLFSCSLMENIAGLGEQIDIERVRQAAILAAIHDEIARMPMGYHSLIGDMGSSLSGGQKQRVLLARALYRQPCVLLLDEATSHLDVDTERRVNNAIRGLGITRISIAHRPDTIAAADRVVQLAGLPS